MLSFLREIWIGEFFTARQRCAVDLVAPDDLFLFSQDQFVPHFHHHLDLAHAHVGSTGCPRTLIIPSLDPQVLIEFRLGILSLDVGGSVLEAKKITRRFLGL